MFCSHSWHNDVIICVSIVRDQCTAIIDAGELDFGGVNLVNGRVVRFTVVLDNDGIRVDSGCCKFSVSAICNFYISAEIVKDHTMGAHVRVEQRFLLVVVKVIFVSFVEREARIHVVVVFTDIVIMAEMLLANMASKFVEVILLVSVVAASLNEMKLVIMVALE